MDSALTDRRAGIARLALAAACGAGFLWGTGAVAAAMMGASALQWLGGALLIGSIWGLGRCGAGPTAQ